MKYKFRFLVLLFSSIIFPLSIVSSESAKPNKNNSVKPVENLCIGLKSKGDKEWSEPEKFVLKQLCDEKEADLSKWNRIDVSSDKSYDLWAEMCTKWDFSVPPLCEYYNKESERVLTSKFLKAILLDERYNKELPTRIRIKGAVFEDEIDFISEKISKEVSLTDSTFKKKVDLSNSTFSKSVNFENSKFNNRLVFNDATVNGGLSFNSTTFSNSETCLTSLINLQRIEVKGDLEFINTIFSCPNPNPNLETTDNNSKNQINEGQTQEINLIDLKAAKIKVSVYLKAISVKSPNTAIDWKQKQWGSFKAPTSQLGVGLIAAEVGDAVIINQTKVDNKQIDFINMSEIKANTLISFVSSDVAQKITDYRIFKLFNSNNNHFETSQFNEYLSQLVINLENANINTINILDSKHNSEHNSNIGNNGNTCKVKLGGFNYRQLNITAYKFLTICIDSLYQDAITDRPDQQADQQEESNEANGKLIRLLQPMEKLSIVSKNLGIYSVEKEMMHRQKKLDYFLAKTNLTNSKINIVKVLTDIGKKPVNSLFDTVIGPVIVESGHILVLSFTLVSNIFQDIFSGYGFERLRIFRVILILLIANFFLALFVSFQKQKKIADNSLYLRIKEIQDEKLKQFCNTNESPLNLEDISNEIDLIKQIIFDEFDPKNNLFYLYLKYNDDNKPDSYKKIKLDDDEFKYLIEIADIRSPNHTKVGFCKNYYPRGNWSVVIPSSDHEVDLYLIKHQKLIKRMKRRQFNSINPFSPLLMLIKSTSDLLTERTPWIPKLLIKIKQRFTVLIKCNLIKCFVNHPLIASFVVTFLIGLFIIVIIFIPYPISNFIAEVFMNISKFEVLIVSVLFFWILFVILRFVQPKKLDSSLNVRPEQKDSTWIALRNLENAFLFSIDILIPIIELDKDNTDFIIDAAEDYFWIRIYFRMEKLIGPLLISVLLPLLLLTGL